jgi:hypothetical protein
MTDSPTKVSKAGGQAFDKPRCRNRSRISQSRAQCDCAIPARPAIDDLQANILAFTYSLEIPNHCLSFLEGLSGQLRVDAEFTRLLREAEADKPSFLLLRSPGRRRPGTTSSSGSSCAPQETPQHTVPSLSAPVEVAQL